MSPTEHVMLSVVIPAFNEEGRIGGSIERIASYLGATGCASEIIVVDDGSSDGTARAVEAFVRGAGNVRLLKNVGNRGKGYSVRRGALSASGRFVLMCDADLSTPIEEAEKLLRCLRAGGCDVAIGSRGLPQSDVRVPQSVVRQSMGKVFNVFVRLLVLGGIRDTQCGFKCFTARAARAIFSRQRIKGFCFDVEILLIARRLGCRVREVPVTWINSPASSVRLLREPARMFADLLRIGWHAWCGGYDRARAGA